MFSLKYGTVRREETCWRKHGGTAACRPYLVYVASNVYLEMIWSSWQTKIQDGCHVWDPIYCQFKVQRHSHQVHYSSNLLSSLSLLPSCDIAFMAFLQPTSPLHLQKSVQTRADLVQLQSDLQSLKITCTHSLLRTSYGATDCSSMRYTSSSIHYWVGLEMEVLAYTSSHPQLSGIEQSARSQWGLNVAIVDGRLLTFGGRWLLPPIFLMKISLRMVSSDPWNTCLYRVATYFKHDAITSSMDADGSPNKRVSVNASNFFRSC